MWWVTEDNAKATRKGKGEKRAREQDIREMKVMDNKVMLIFAW